MKERFRKTVKRVRQLNREVWEVRDDSLSATRGASYAFARVLAITFAGLKENRILSRAAALSFNSLLGLGPLVALMVMVSGFVLQQAEPGTAQDTIERAVAFIAPQVELANSDDPESKTELATMINRFIEASRSGAVGLSGAILLTFIVIQLFISIEDAFNDIWGIAKGRPLLTRVFLCWTIVTLGAVTLFAGIAFALAEIAQLNAQFSELTDGIPGSTTVSTWLNSYGPNALRFAVIIAVLAAFYRFIPNIQVEWKAAFAGAVATAILFAVNNALAFVYLERVAMQRTLYGSLGILPVLMIGLYFFWFFLLLGGRFSYAAQNARFKSGQMAWDSLSPVSQESLCLLLLAKVSRRFAACGKAPSGTELADENKLPRPLVVAALNRLADLGYASVLPDRNTDLPNSQRYQPARPLEKIQLLELKEAMEGYGENPASDYYAALDPTLAHYRKLIAQARRSSFADTTLAEVLQPKRHKT